VRPDCRQAIASRDTAALNLKRTEVRASVNGFITNLTLAKGTYASQGKPVMALIDSDSYRVEAYFEETKIPHVKPGGSAEIYLMDGSPALQGTVSSIARGITDQDNKDGPELLSSINPTFTGVRLAQRIPVGIHLTHVPPSVLISAGMTDSTAVKTMVTIRTVLVGSTRLNESIALISVSEPPYMFSAVTETRPSIEKIRTAPLNPLKRVLPAIWRDAMVS